MVAKLSIRRYRYAGLPERKVIKTVISIAVRLPSRSGVNASHRSIMWTRRPVGPEHQNRERRQIYTIAGEH